MLIYSLSGLGSEEQPQLQVLGWEQVLPMQM